MALPTSIGEIFGNFGPNAAVAQAAVPITPVVPVQPPGTVIPDVSPATVVPGATVEVKAPDSPLDQFADLWDTPILKDGETAPVDPNAPLELSPEQVQTVVDKADLTSAITPEHLAAITAGGEGAAVALSEMLALVAKNTLTQATLVNHKLTAQAVERAQKQERANLPDQLREQANALHASTTNPLFDNPAVKTVVEATRSQLEVKYPNWTPQQVTEATQQYIITMGEAFAPTITPPEQQESQNWDKFIS